MTTMRRSVRFSAVSAYPLLPPILSLSSAYLQPTPGRSSAYLSLPQPTSAYSRKVLSLSSAYLQPTPGRSSAYLSLPQPTPGRSSAYLSLPQPTSASSPAYTCLFFELI
jgi:hypothetical protein